MLFATHLLRTLRRHWPHYLVEAAGLVAFLIFSSVAAVVCFHPSSAVARALGPHAWVQRLGVGLIVGGLVAAMAYSPWGKRSGAHFNPAVTLGFWQLGHIRTADAIWYVVAQFAGALVAGVAIFWLLAPWFSHPAVHYNTTRPPEGAYGWVIALGAEILISGALMMVMLSSLHSARLKQWTGAFVGLLLALFVVVEAPLSGMSLNPARTLGSAMPAGGSPGLWLYFVGPLTATWVTAIVYGRWRRRHSPTERPPVYPDYSAE
ncbi:aquaporin [Hymenobacter sp. UYCo722]|uniref:MIP/aquaporin family protein n=1 Tax=Hymenobacter sp. UYCo722 TaxID=3156335 RepID=UPI003392AB15